MGKLFRWLSGQDERAYAVTYNWTNLGSKSATMNGMMVLADELPGFRVIHIMDRNANVLELERLMDDYDRMLENPGLVILVARRNTSNTIEPIGRQSEAVEGGHGAALRAVPDKIGTGWANIAAIDFGSVLRSLSFEDYPVLSFGCHPKKSCVSDFGLAGFIPNGLGKSEDLWSVFQQAHNTIGLGLEPQFGVTHILLRVKLRGAPQFIRRERAAAGRVVRRIDRHAAKPDSAAHQLFRAGRHLRAEGAAKCRARLSDGPLRCPQHRVVVCRELLSDAMNPFVGIQMVFWMVGILFSQALTSACGLSASIRARGNWLGREFAWGGVVFSAVAGLWVGWHSPCRGSYRRFGGLRRDADTLFAGGRSVVVEEPLVGYCPVRAPLFLEAISVFTRLAAAATIRLLHREVATMSKDTVAGTNSRRCGRTSSKFTENRVVGPWRLPRMLRGPSWERFWRPGWQLGRYSYVSSAWMPQTCC